MTRRRTSYLDVGEFKALNDWAAHVIEAFGGNVPYLVGSSLHDPNYRDVDVRQILRDEVFDALASLVDVGRLGFVFSLWGKAVTGLRIDYQIQRQSDANSEFDGPRYALILSRIGRSEER